MKDAKEAARNASTSASPGGAAAGAGALQRADADGEREDVGQAGLVERRDRVGRELAGLPQPAQEPGAEASPGADGVDDLDLGRAHVGLGDGVPGERPVPAGGHHRQPGALAQDQVDDQRRRHARVQPLGVGGAQLDHVGGAAQCSKRRRKTSRSPAIVGRTFGSTMTSRCAASRCISCSSAVAGGSVARASVPRCSATTSLPRVGRSSGCRSA